MFLNYPYTDLYNLNLDWMIKSIKEVQEIIGELGTVVNSVNNMSGDVVLTKEFILGLLGTAVEKFNGRSGDVTLTAADVNATAIDLTYVSDPGETVEDFTAAELREMYESGKRLMILLNNLGTPDRLYCLVPVGNSIQAQPYTPNAETAGVVTVNGQSGTVTLSAENLPVSPSDLNTSIADDLSTLSGQIVNLGGAIAYTETGTTAGRTYTAGQYILWNNALYTVNSEGLPSGTAISGNVTAVTGGGINSLHNRLKAIEANKSAGTVDISSYDVNDNKYTCPSDGYAYLKNESGQNCQLYIIGSNNVTFCVIGGQEGFFSLFVRKGMQIGPFQKPAASISFRPIME